VECLIYIEIYGRDCGAPIDKEGRGDLQGRKARASVVGDGCGEASSD